MTIALDASSTCWFLARQLPDIDLFIFSCEGVDGCGVMRDSSAHNASYKSLLLKRASQSLLLIR